MMDLLSRLFGNGNGNAKGPALEPAALGQSRTPCPTCDRQVLPGSRCPFCQSHAFSKPSCDTTSHQQPLKEKLEAVGGVIIAMEAAREFGAKAFLHVFHGKSRGETILLGSNVVGIGRDATTSTLGLSDGGVSARHCEVRPAGDGFEIVDLDAKNGTFLNDGMVRQAALADGDVISIGQSRIYFWAA